MGYPDRLQNGMMPFCTGVLRMVYAVGYFAGRLSKLRSLWKIIPAEARMMLCLC